VPRLCGFYPGICLTTEDKERKNPKKKHGEKRAKKCTAQTAMNLTVRPRRGKAYGHHTVTAEPDIGRCAPTTLLHVCILMLMF